ncbi:MAG TPA: hypothetical protein VK420_22480 [Longimicrobium sp.]|nr:hypothetical protein [Longimicrobium sp.]
MTVREYGRRASFSLVNPFRTLENAVTRLTLACAVLVSLSLIGCDSRPPPEPRSPELAAFSRALTYGGEETIEDDDGTVPDPDRPCGDQTVDVLRGERGGTFAFCVAPDGQELTFEDGEEGVPSMLDGSGLTAAACASEIYRYLAPDREVPEALLKSCEGRTPLPEEPRARVQRLAPIQMTLPYCGTSGAVNFQKERCDAYLPLYPNDPHSQWCITDKWGWHDRALSWQLAGEEGDYGSEAIASCGGSTRFRAFWRWDVGDKWFTAVDKTVLPGHWAIVSIYTTGWSEDIDVRFRATSAKGAFHRHTGLFEDY